MLPSKRCYHSLRLSDLLSARGGRADNWMDRPIIIDLNSEFEESSFVLVPENSDRFAIRLTEQISCRTSVSLRSRNPNAPRTSTTTIPNFGICHTKKRAASERLNSTRPSFRSPLSSANLNRLFV